MAKDNTVIIEDIHVNLEEVSKNHESIETLKALAIFPEGPKQEGSYEALWQAVNEFKSRPVDSKVVIKKKKDKT